jgi:Putative Flp pilus-assembly TadE/G-like
MKPPQRLRTRHRRQRGSVITLAALLLTSLLGMCAVVVDLANHTQNQRQAQASADAAALAAAQDLPNATAVVATVKTYASENYGIAASRWVGCRDIVDGSNRALTVRPDSANDNQCISLDAAYSRVRVNLPTTQIATSFAKVLGVKKTYVRAQATAEALLSADNRIIPAAVTASMGTGNLCIENSGNNTSCAARSSGNFGSLDSPRLNIFKAASNTDPTELAINYAMSTDHLLAIWGNGTRICDGNGNPFSPCTATNVGTTLTANHLRTYTGNAIPPVTEGYVAGFTASTTDQGSLTFCGRLSRPDTTLSNLTQPRPGGSCTPGGPTITSLGITINGRHAYYWLTPTARAVFYPEVGATNVPLTNAVYSTGDARLECFLDGYRYDYATGVETVPTCPGVTWPVGTTVHFPIFTKNTVTDPRFGMIPILQSWPNGASSPIPLVGFWAAFIYRVYPNGGNNKVDGLDSWVFEPALIETESGVPGLQFGFQPHPIVHLVE